MDKIDEEEFFSQNKAKTASERINRKKTQIIKNRKTVAPLREKKRPKKLKTMRSKSFVELRTTTSIFEAPLGNTADAIR